MKNIKLMLGLMLLPFIGVSQSTTATNTQNATQTRFLGFTNNFPLYTQTNGVNRMTINGQNGLTDGYVGIGNTNPLYKLHVTADVALPSANAQGWKRGILLSNTAALSWEGSTNSELILTFKHLLINRNVDELISSYILILCSNSYF